MYQLKDKETRHARWEANKDNQQEPAAVNKSQQQTERNGNESKQCCSESHSCHCPASNERAQSSAGHSVVSLH